MLTHPFDKEHQRVPACPSGGNKPCAWFCSRGQIGGWLSQKGPTGFGFGSLGLLCVRESEWFFPTGKLMLYFRDTVQSLFRSN
eukprot:SAG25_NODE_1295_length_3362_cov_18.009194_3_plen_83_part_00